MRSVRAVYRAGVLLAPPQAARPRGTSNAAIVPMPEERSHTATTIGGVLRQQAAAMGPRPFLKIWASGQDTAVSLSFAEVHWRTELAAAALRARGCAAKDRIALLSHASAQCFIYSLGTMMLGAAAVQLNWRQPVEKLEAMLRTAGAATLLASAQFGPEARDLRRACGITLLWLQEPRAARTTVVLGVRCALNAEDYAEDCVLLALDGATVPSYELPIVDSVPFSSSESPAAAEGVALIMFTSGSTGNAKGVPLTHAQVLWNCEQRHKVHGEVFSHDGDAGTLSFLPNFHVVGFINNFLFNLRAGIFASVDRDAGKNTLTAQRLLEACAALRPTVLDTVPLCAESLAPTWPPLPRSHAHFAHMHACAHAHLHACNMHTCTCAHAHVTSPSPPALTRSSPHPCAQPSRGSH